MQLYICNVGYGDAFLFTCDKGVCLIDTGSGLDSEYVNSRIPIGRLLDYLNIKCINHLIISHIHEDHVGGLRFLRDRVKIENIWLPFSQDNLINEFMEIDIDKIEINSVRLFYMAVNTFVKEMSYLQEHADIHILSAKESTNILGMDIDVLGSKKASIDNFLLAYRGFKDKSENKKIDTLRNMDRLSNGTSLVLNIKYKGFNALFTGDNVPKNWEKDQYSFNLLNNVNVLKLPHHGQIDSIEKELMEKMPIEYCITTASSDFRHNSAAISVYENMLNWHKQDIKFIFNELMDFKYCNETSDYNYIVWDLEDFNSEKSIEFKRV